MTTPGTDLGPLWRWCGRVEEGLHALRLRQDDMRREMLLHVHRLETEMRKKPRWWRMLPLKEILFMALWMIAGLGYIKPGWIRFLSGQGLP